MARKTWHFYLDNFLTIFLCLSSLRPFTNPKARWKCLKSPPQPTLWTSRGPSGPSSSLTKQVCADATCRPFAWRQPILFAWSSFHCACVCVSQQYIYTDLAAKERAHYTPEADTPNMGLARRMKVVYSDVSLLSFCRGLCYLLEGKKRIIFTSYCCSKLFSTHQNKYKEQYEKMKHRYTAIADTPLLIRSKKAYFQSSDVSALTC